MWGLEHAAGCGCGRLGCGGGAAPQLAWGSLACSEGIRSQAASSVRLAAFHAVPLLALLPYWGSTLQQARVAGHGQASVMPWQLRAAPCVAARSGGRARGLSGAAARTRCPAP